jgi:hypothetical protein
MGRVFGQCCPMPMISAPRAPPRRDCRPASTRNQYLRRFDDVQQGRRLHPDSRHTERSSGEWVVPLVRFHGRRSREDLCPTEPTIESLLTDLAVHGYVAAPTQPAPQRPAGPLPRGAQTHARPAHRRPPGSEAHTRADGADHGVSPKGDESRPRVRGVHGHLTRRHGRAMDGLSAVRRDRPQFRPTADRRARWPRHGRSGQHAARQPCRLPPGTCRACHTGTCAGRRPRIWLGRWTRRPGTNRPTCRATLALARRVSLKPRGASPTHGDRPPASCP